MGIRTTPLGFADRVQDARRTAGLSVVQLSTQTGIPLNTLRRRLVGDEGRFTLDELSRIADATGTSFEFILVGQTLTQKAG